MGRLKRRRRLRDVLELLADAGFAAFALPSGRVVAFYRNDPACMIHVNATRRPEIRAADRMALGVAAATINALPRRRVVADAAVAPLEGGLRVGAGVDHAMTETLDAARRYAIEYGWPVLPIRPRDKVPLTRHGVADATTDYATIMQWADRWPDMNLAVATGAPGPQVLDIDRPQDAMALLAVLHKGTPAEVATARGRHLYYIGLDRGTVNLEFGELRGQGSYVLVPPSIHPSGKAYVWIVEPNGPLTAVPAELAVLGQPAGVGVMEARNGKVSVGARHDHLKDVATRLVRSGIVDVATLERLLRAEYEAACVLEPPAHRTEFVDLAKWAAGTRIAARERMGPIRFGPVAPDDPRTVAKRVVDDAGGWAPLTVKRVKSDGTRLVDAIHVELSDGTEFDFARQGDITSRLWGKTVTVATRGRATPQAMKDPELMALYTALARLGDATPAMTEADELREILAGLLAIVEPLTGYTIETSAGRFALIAALRHRAAFDPGDRQALQQPVLVIDKATGVELLRAGDLMAWFRHRGAGITPGAFGGRMRMIGLEHVRLNGREPRTAPGHRATNHARFYVLSTNESEDVMTDQPTAPEPAEPDPEAPTPTEVAGEQLDLEEAVKGAEKAEEGVADPE